MSRVLKKTTTINGSTSSSSWTWKQVIDEYFETDKDNSLYYISSNKSIAVVSTYLGVASGRSSSSFGGTANLNITCNGEQKNTTGSWIYQSFWIPSGGWKLIQQEEFQILHETDGSKTVNVSSSLSTGDFNPNYASASGTVELTTIPRANTIAVSDTNLGSNVAIVIGRAVNTFKSTLLYEIGDITGTIVEKWDDTSYVWTLSSSLINQIKLANNTKTVSATIKCITYDEDDNQIGSQTNTTFNLIITDKPTITNVVKAELNSNISSKTTAVLKYISDLKFTITAVAPVGTTIASYRIINGSRSVSGTSNQLEFQNIQDYDSTTNKTTFNVIATDERGNESEIFSVNYDFINYVDVSINKTDVVVKRTNATTSDAIVYLTGNFFNGLIGNTTNNITLNYKYRKQGTESWSALGTITLTKNNNTFKADNILLSGTFNYSDNWEFEFIATDSLNETDNYIFIFANSDPSVIEHSKGMFIKELDTNKLLIENKSIVDIIYPIGSIYTSTNSISPQTLFGGTWTQLKDKFLLSAGDIYEGGSTGGEAEHTLTIDEMPRHTHDLPNQNGSGNDGTYPNSWGQKGWIATPPICSTGQAGGGQSHNNMPPYIAVYVWERTE